MTRKLGTRTFICRECGNEVTMTTSNARVFCSSACKAAARRRLRRPFIVRSLEPGEKIPEGTPLRYKNRGYVNLRWAAPDGTFIQGFEHRIFDGRNTTAENVHHINHVRDDNRPENLQQVTAAEHQEIHRQEALERYAEWKRMYEQGYSTIQVAEQFGTHAGNVYRGITELGARIRKPGEYKLPIPAAEAVRRYKAGEGATSIARSLGVSYPRLIKVIEAHGVQRRPQGRVPGA